MQNTISIHTPTKGVTYMGYGVTMSFYNFNPHSHEGSDQKTDRKNKVLNYFNPHSHEGSDIQATQNTIHYIISIHTPTKGVTVQNIVQFVHYIISIHTPTKGVTLNAYKVKYINTNFNPHSHEGSDSNINQ